MKMGLQMGLQMADQNRKKEQGCCCNKFIKSTESQHKSSSFFPRPFQKDGKTFFSHSLLSTLRDGVGADEGQM